MNVEKPNAEQLVDAVAKWKFSEETDSRMQLLMDLNNEGLLTLQEREELASLVELGETLSLRVAQELIERYGPSQHK